MSRSNHHYYGLCEDVGEDGWCEWHRPFRYHYRDGSQSSLIRMTDHCLGEAEFLTRRGVVQRKKRFPKWSWKSWCRNPPRAVKRVWERQLRAKYKAAIQRLPDDPEFLNGNKWLSGQYQYWS